MKAITLNDQPHQTTAADVAALISSLGLAPGTTLVEHNGTALRPGEWTQPLADGDCVELMRISAGG